MTVQLNKYIDHTLLKPVATIEQIMQLCKEATEYNFAAVCVNPCYVSLSAHLLSGTGIKVATVIGFPLGANMAAVKVFEAQSAILAKADELDMVINLGAAKSGLWDAVYDEIDAVVNASKGKIIKVIIETGLLTDDEKRRACETLLRAGAHFVKTSTGFGPGGATVHDIKLLKSVIGDTSRCGIKASGGIKLKADALNLIEAGATRIGCSAGVSLVR